VKYTDWGHLAASGRAGGHARADTAAPGGPTATPGRPAGAWWDCRKCGRLSVRLVTVGLRQSWPAGNLNGRYSTVVSALCV
jgi:hypothetical protein